MNRRPIETTALLAQALSPAANGTPRHFIPARRIPVAPGSKLAQRVGLRKYGGKGRGPGFVIQTHTLIATLREIFDALDRQFPANAPHAFRSDGPLLFFVDLPSTQYRYLAEIFQMLAPSIFETNELFSKISIPSGLRMSELDAAVNMLMTFPMLRSTTVKQLSLITPNEHFGLNIIVRHDDLAPCNVIDLNDLVDDHSAISSFLAQIEPLPR